MPDLNITTLSKSASWNMMSHGACVSWITILLVADKNGFTEGSAEYLARVARIPLEEFNGYIDEMVKSSCITPTEDGFQCLDAERYFWVNRGAILQRAYRARQKAKKEGGAQ